MENKEKKVAAETVTTAAGHGGRAEPTGEGPLYALTAAGKLRWRLAKKNLDWITYFINWINWTSLNYLSFT